MQIIMKVCKFIFRILLLLPLLALLCISTACIYPSLLCSINHPGCEESSSLKEKETISGNTVRIDYINRDGRLTFAYDEGYATLIMILDDRGLCIREEYLDETGAPAILSSGISMVEHTYNENELPEMTIYMDSHGNPANYNSIYHGYVCEFNELGQNTVIRFLGPDGIVCPNAYGYAILCKDFDEKDQLVEEHYFDTDMKPVINSSGSAGLINEYDSSGNKTKITYLNLSDKPSPNTSGYAIRRFEYNEVGLLVKETYYDENDVPVASTGGHYGIQYKDERQIYLNKDGTPMFSLSHFLLDSHFAVAVIGVLLCVLSLITGRRFNALLLILYIGFIVFMTLFGHEQGVQLKNMDLFWSYRQFMYNPEIRFEVLNNIWLFVPLGVILFRALPRRPYIFLIPFILTIAIEYTQYRLGIGLCELDDILGNTIGSIIGILAAWAFF